MIVKQLITKLAFKNDESGYRKYKSTQNKAKKHSEQFVRSIKSDHIGLHKRVIYGHARMVRNMVRGMRSYKARAAQTYSQIASSAARSFDRIRAAQQKSLSFRMTAGKAFAGGLTGYLGLSAAKSAGASILGNATNFEGLRASLVTATGSQAAANKEFARLADFAKKFPSEMDEVVASYIRLKNLGLDPSNRALISYGNTAAAMNKNVMDMIEAVADATTGENERLKEFGIKAKKDGDQVTYTFRKQKYTIKNEAKEIEKFLIGMGEKFFGGGMERQSQTIGGKISNLSDAFSMAMDQMWEAGLKYPVKSIVEDLTNFVSRMTPKFVEFGKAADKWAERAAVLYFKVADNIGLLKKVLPAVGIGLSLVTARFVGLQAIVAGGWILKTVWALRGLTIGSIAAQAAVFAIPIAIGAAIAAVGYLGYEIYKFATTGKGLIKRLSDQFPAFGKAVKALQEAIVMMWVEIKPYALEFWQILKDLAAWVYKEGGKAFMWLYKEAIIPMIIEGIKWLTQFIKDWVDGFKTIIQWGQDWYSGYKTIMEWFSKTIRGLMGDFNYWYDGMAGIFDYIKEKFSWLINASGQVGNAVRGAFDWLGFGGSQTGAANGSLTENPNFPLNNKAAAQLVRNARAVYSGAGRCLNGVWKAYNKTFGASHSGTKSLVAAGLPAAEAAKHLARSKDFREIKVTPEMLKDPNMVKLLHGATAVYNRRSGFNSTYGHIEIWDMLNKQSLYGAGKAGSLNRSAHMLKNARVFIPVPAGTGGGGANYNMQQYVNFNGAVSDPAAVANKVGETTKQALDKTARSAPKRTNGLAYTQ